MATALTALHLLIFLGVTLRVLSRPGLNSSVRVVWLFVLLALPIGGLVLYLLVGEIHYSGAGRRLRDGIEARLRPVFEAAGSPPDLPRHGAAAGFAASINGFGIAEGNVGELLDSPQAARERLIADIDAATRSVDLLYYIWLDDGTGRAVAEAVARAAQRGVRCRVMVDAIGSRAIIASPDWAAAHRAGVETAVALPVGNPLTVLSRRVDLRNHRKITVIDGRICHCGSQNCADPEFLVKAAYAPWVDIMVRLEGPVVRQMQLLFIQDWMAERDPAAPLPEDETRPVRGGFAAQVIGTGPTLDQNATAQLFTLLICEAKRELIISTPYFVPGETVCLALMGAARAGVKVTLIVPRRNDSGFVARASRSYYPALCADGVSIAEYEGGLLHAKTLTIDGEKTFMGSSNMDIRSFDLNFENDVLLHDPELTRRVRQRQMDYLADSIPVDPEKVRAWPLHRRIWLNAFAMLGPVL